MAGLWKLPVIFLLENNQYGLTVRQEVQAPVQDLSIRAAGYDMPGEIVDGNDAEAVYRSVAAAAERARRGEGPTLIEAKTYRVKGFSTSDMGGYQSNEEMQPWLDRDPIKLSAEKLAALIGAEAVQAIEASARAEVTKAFETALSDPFPTFEIHAASAAYSETV